MTKNFINLYSNFLKNKLCLKKKIKVVFDCSNGTTGVILKKLLQTNSLINYKLINQAPDGNFPAHEPSPLAKDAMEQLKKEVLQQKADLGAIFDADGDRVFFIDNLGRPVEPDIIARLLIWHLNPRKAVYDIRAGWLVKKLTTNNLQLTTSRVGHFYIKKLMRKINADFGAEKSGHYYFAIQSHGKGKLYYDSGILTAIEVVNAVSKLPYSLADFADLLPQYYRSGEINIYTNQHRPNADLREQSKMENLLKKIENKYKKQAMKISRLDGLIMEFSSPVGDWWLNLRPSNTEPLLRLNVEATNKKLLDKSIKNLYSLIRF